MNLSNRDHNGPSLPLFLRVAIGVFIAIVVIIIIKKILQATLDSKSQQNSNTSATSSNHIHYNPQNRYQQLSPIGTINSESQRNNQALNSEVVIEPLPVYTPPNNTDKLPTYQN